jgi:acyl-CoA thioesterase FadM
MFMALEQAKALLAGTRAGRSAPLEPVRQELRAWPWLCDALGHVNNARYLDLADVGRMTWLARLGLLRAAIREGHTYLIAGASLTYRRQIPRFSRFALETQVVAYDERWLCFSSTFLLQHNGRERIAARAVVRGQVRASGQALNPIELMRRVGGGSQPLPDQPADVAAALRAQDATIEVIRGREA